MLSLLLSAWTGQGAIQTRQQDERRGGSKALSTSPTFNQINQEQNKEKRCVDKVVSIMSAVLNERVQVVLEERVEWEMGEDCSHSYSTRCFSSLTTRYTPTQVHNTQATAHVFRFWLRTFNYYKQDQLLVGRCA